MTRLSLMQICNHYLFLQHVLPNHTSQPAAAAPVTSSGGVTSSEGWRGGRRLTPSRDGDGTAGLGGGSTPTGAATDTGTDHSRHQDRPTLISGQTTTDTRTDHRRRQDKLRYTVHQDTPGTRTGYHIQQNRPPRTPGQATIHTKADPINIRLNAYSGIAGQ